MSHRIPVVMYHSIGIVDREWHWNFLTCPYKVFEDQLKWLKKTGYSTLNFQEVYDYIINEIPVPKKSVFLTFDDGYLDNYVFAYPLLKKYGMKGTIFVNSDFVDKRKVLRRTINDIDINNVEDLDYLGFCSWDELKKIDKEGVLDVQSHAKTHTWYPTSDKIIDFRHPGDDYIWMDWNENPEQKPFLQCVNVDNVKYGHAIFEHEKALSSKRVFINADFQNELYDFVNRNGRLKFFNDNKWRERLMNYVKEIEKNNDIIDEVESNKNYLLRVEEELKFTKNKIESKLDKEVKFLCWPGGSGTADGIRISEDLGYLMSTAARDLSNEFRKKMINSPDQKINRISRFTPIMYNNWKKNDPESKVRYSPGWFFILQLTKFQNTYFAGFWVKLIHYFIIKINKKSAKKR